MPVYCVKGMTYHIIREGGGNLARRGGGGRGGIWPGRGGGSGQGGGGGESGQGTQAPITPGPMECQTRDVKYAKVSLSLLQCASVFVITVVAWCRCQYMCQYLSLPLWHGVGASICVSICHYRCGMV